MSASKLEITNFHSGVKRQWKTIGGPIGEPMSCTCKDSCSCDGCGYNSSHTASYNSH